MGLYIFISVFFISFFATKFLITYFNHKKILDIPNVRSNHTIPVPRVGGIAIILSLFVYIAIAKNFGLTTIFSNEIIISILILSVVSLIDDIKSLGPLFRFATQIFAVLIALYSLPNDKLLFKGSIPLIYDRIISLFALVWFINLYNFMDGIDGITGAESIHILFSILLITIIYNLNENYNLDYIAIISVILGFLFWNWHPAKIFLGDVGSINLGFILGWVLFNLASEGFVFTPIIIASYYIADSGITIVRRLFQGKKIWQAHSEHFYQIAVKNGNPHNKVVRQIIIANIFIMISSIISLYVPWISIILVFVIISILLIYLKKTNLRVDKIEQ